MGEAFLNTVLLPDLKASDLFWRFPAFKIYLPEGLIPIEGTSDCIWFILVTRLTPNDNGRLFVPADLETEFQQYIAKVHTGLEYSSFRQLGLREELLTLSISHYSSRNGFNTDSMSMQYRLDGRSLAQICATINETLVRDFSEAELWRPDPLLKAFHLAVMTLFYWGTTPEEKAFPPRQLRPIRFGPIFRSGLFEPRWVGEKTVFKNRPKPLKKRPDGTPRRHYIGHWVCGHQKRQAYGPGLSLRKLIWIMPYKTE
jgi:hypothetical protein